MERRRKKGVVRSTRLCVHSSFRIDFANAMREPTDEIVVGLLCIDGLSLSAGSLAADTTHKRNKKKRRARERRA